MEAEPVDLVVSDMRMPEMDGAGLLEQVCERWPTVGRILLTGYADVGSMVAAVNRGHIHRYVAKPWDDWDLLRSVQNDKLQCLNAGLAARVKVRTTELEQVNAMLETSFAQLQQNFLLSIHVFAGLIERRAGGQAGYSRQVADLAQRIARRLDGGAMLERDVYIAGLLHEIGKIDFPETMLCKPLSAMTSDELALYRQHTLNGEAALQPLDQLRRVARYIRSYQERFDGKGFPDALSGEEVPLGAQILGIARDYYAAQSGRMALERSSPAEAHSLIVDGTGTRYEASIVEAFELALEDELIEKPLDRELPAHPLLPGMALSRDLQSGGSLRDEIRD
jgi:response regulator RpfG family c-di-GMP phosphodiesterase